jgi:hypothetical protein
MSVSVTETWSYCVLVKCLLIKIICLLQIFVAFSHRAGLVLNVLCLDFGSIYDVSFTDLKEDPHCMMMQSSAKAHESLTQGTGDQNYNNNDKTPSMEEKLQEVEKVRITYYFFTQA